MCVYCSVLGLGHEEQDDESIWALGIMPYVVFAEIHLRLPEIA